MTYYRLGIKEAYFARLSFVEVRDKMKALVDIGVVLIDVNIAPDPEPPKPPEVREVKVTVPVNRYVCFVKRCNATFATAAGLKKHYARRHQKVEVKV